MAFTTSDCTGQGYLFGAPTMYLSAAISGPARTVYLQTRDQPRRRMMRSYLDHDRCRETFTEWPAVPVRPTDVHLREYFTPPFVLRATRGDEVTRATTPAAPGTASPSTQDAFFHAGRLRIFDGHGTFVGTASRASSTENGTAVALLTESGTVIIVQVSRNRLWTHDPFVHFEEPDCAGEALIVTRTHGELAPNIVVTDKRRRVWKPTGPIGPRTVRSYWGTGECVNGRYPALDAWFARAVWTGVDLADYFVAPFSVRTPRGNEIPPLEP